MENHTADRSQLIQAYMSLHSQQTNVRRRLSQDSAASSSPESPVSCSPSPTRTYSTFMRRSSRSSSLRSSSPPSRRSSIEPIPELPEEDHPSFVISSDELKLNDITNKIKTTLTDLLNCDGVRGDSRMRNWVAKRLMDVEHDLKESKRRFHNVDMNQVDAIAAHLRE